MTCSVSVDKINLIGQVLSDKSKSIQERFRALFTLKNIGGHICIDAIGKTLVEDASVLLKHECAYCLGQMGNEYANRVLIDVLSNPKEHPMVRHEAGEALGAIGHEAAIEALKKFINDPHPEVSETCQLALKRIEWLKQSGETCKDSVFTSVDPAPPTNGNESVDNLKSVLLDSSADLFQRYRAMFALRNINTDKSAQALAEGLKCQDSALFRHEIAFVLGQMQNPTTVNQLAASLENIAENAMVRHECAEALGAIANQDSNQVLGKFINDDQIIVRQSVEVALDISDYSSGDQFQYADGLNKVNL